MTLNSLVWFLSPLRCGGLSRDGFLERPRHGASAREPSVSDLVSHSLALSLSLSRSRSRSLSSLSLFSGGQKVSTTATAVLSETPLLSGRDVCRSCRALLAQSTW